MIKNTEAHGYDSQIKCRPQLRCGCRNKAQPKIPIKCPAPISAENKDVATVKNPSDLPANKKEVKF